MLFQFQQRGIFRAEKIKKYVKSELKNFDLNCDYLRQLNFDTDYSFSKHEYDATLWLREVYLSG